MFHHLACATQLAKIVDEDQERQRRLRDPLRTANNPLLPPPAKLFGFTYASFYLEKTTFPASGVACAPRVFPIGTAKFSTLGDGGFVEKIRVGGGPIEGDGIVGEGTVGAGQLQQKKANLLFFVTATVYNGKGMLTEAQQVSDNMRCPIFVCVVFVKLSACFSGGMTRMASNNA